MNEWKKVLVPPNTSIQEAINVIDKSSLQIALVVDNNNHLLGTVTDGDIRRGILKGIPLEAPVSRIMNTRPITIGNTKERSKIIKLLNEKKLRHLPVVDENWRILGLERLDELILNSRNDTWVVLMAGGLGSRLKPLTDNCPKPMLAINGKPVLEIILTGLAEQGFYKFFISLNYKAEQIKAYFGDGSKWGAEIDYINEEKRMGTAGSLRLLSKLPEKPVIVMNADILTKLSFNQLLGFHGEHQAKATVAVYTYDFQVPYGVVKVNKDFLVGFEEKPVYTNFINSGIYVLNPEALSRIPENTYYDMDKLLGGLLNDGEHVSVFPIREYWTDIGTLEDYSQAMLDYCEVFR